ncbi:MBL fold metallo-hydrolase RNA specificity domain-containing protein [Harryflintia acetispora]|uniref:MBL fold metallo-hydrolase RNA specificity domain-containing protein n=1 Tax=Harryflintia acetispora TaxID=1849041 RepID=UPI00189C3A5B
MKLTIYGAAHEVTGSCFCLEACGKKILVDCGLQQGPDEYENRQLDFTPAEIDYVLLTHAHIDHSGKLPLLYQYGFRGQVHTTGATADLCDIMLRDSAHIQMFEAEWRNRKGKRAGKEEYIPLYDMDDAIGVLGCFVPHHYGEQIGLCGGISFRFVDVGHLLGSASVEVWVEENNVRKKLVFSGDIGNTDQPLIRDPGYIDEADYVVMESTYGTRSHGERPDYVGQLSAIIQNTFDRGGNVVIPSFAVGRTQEMLYFLRRIKADHLVKGHGDFPVYVDSPLAVEATNIFNENEMEYYDAEALSLVRQGINPISFPGLRVSVSTEESRAINSDEEPKVILSASGMCDAGRIKHHLKHNLWRRESTVLFVGYQAVGSLGRAILDGAKKVRLFGEEIEVHAEIRRLDGISGHADREGLLCWLQHFKEKPKRVLVVHGASESCGQFCAALRELGYNADAPYTGAKYDLAANACLEAGIPRVQHREPARRVSDVFLRLQAAGRRLMAVIGRNEGGTNKDLGRFADQIDALCDKWDR